MYHSPEKQIRRRRGDVEDGSAASADEKSGNDAWSKSKSKSKSKSGNRLALLFSGMTKKPRSAMAREMWLTESRTCTAEERKVSVRCTRDTKASTSHIKLQ